MRKVAPLGELAVSRSGMIGLTSAATLCDPRRTGRPWRSDHFRETGNNALGLYA